MDLREYLTWILYRRGRLQRAGNEINRFSFIDRSTILEGCNYLGRGAIVRKSYIGKYSYIVSGKLSLAKIGRFCSIAQGVVVGGLGRHPLDLLSTHPIFFSDNGIYKKPWARRPDFREHDEVSMGSDVWIGAHAMILDGVSIGHGSVVATGAVVTKDVSPYSVVGGVPAKVIKMRFDEGTVQRLLELNWWDSGEDLLRAEARFFVDPKIACDNKIEILRGKIAATKF